jgi:hypothetical protein
VGQPILAAAGFQPAFAEHEARLWPKNRLKGGCGQDCQAGLPGRFARPTPGPYFPCLDWIACCARASSSAVPRMATAFPGGNGNTRCIFVSMRIAFTVS